MREKRVASRTFGEEWKEWCRLCLAPSLAQTRFRITRKPEFAQARCHVRASSTSDIDIDIAQDYSMAMARK